MSAEKPKAGPPEMVWIGPDPIVRGPKCVWYAAPLVHAAHCYVLASVAEARIRELENIVRLIRKFDDVADRDGNVEWYEIKLALDAIGILGHEEALAEARRK
jgi:hypothetical protein